MNMKKIIMITFCSLLLTLSFGSEITKASTDTSADMSATVQSFYRAYITDLDNDLKCDSILSRYCTTELKDFIQETLSIDDYDFVLDGRGGSNINPNSVTVIKQDDKYKVKFNIQLQYLRNEIVSDSLYILINQDKKISHIIRPVDNYTVPHN